MDFETNYTWADTEETQTFIAMRYRFFPNNIDQNYEQINKEDTISIDGKEMICLPVDDTNFCLLYQHSNDLYLAVELEEIARLDLKSGDSIESSNHLSDILANQSFKDSFHISITQK